MKCRASKLLLFLLLGAIVNVAVAWCITSVGMNRMRTVNELPKQEFEELQEWWNRDAPPTFHRPLANPQSVMYWQGFGMAGTIAYEFKPESNVAEWGDVCATGWPLPSLFREMWWSSGTLETVTDGWRIQESLSGTLPLRPKLGAFAINTIFYAAVMWMVFALPFALRRRRRIKRGLCPACAYPVGTSPICTECGKPVQTQKAETA